MDERNRMPLRQPIPPPWGLIGMVALVVAVERFEVRRDYAFESGHVANWRTTGERLKRNIKDAGILCFGDSLAKDGVYPPVLQQVTGKKAYNLAVATGPAPASYVLFRRALDRGARPSVVLIDLDADVLKEGPRSTNRPYPWADLLNPRELAELAWTAHDPELFVRIGVKKLLHSYKNRFEIREAIVTALDGKQTWLRANLPGLFRNWSLNNGAQVNAAGGFIDGTLVPESLPAETSTWTCDPVNHHYLEQFLCLAERRGIAVFWIVPPFSPCRQSHVRFRGLEAATTRFIREVQARHPRLVVVDGRHSGYDSSAFFDAAHMNRVGGTCYSESLGGLINSYLDKPAAFPSWARLPDFHPTPSAPPLEDVGQSIGIASVNSAAADVRFRR